MKFEFTMRVWTLSEIKTGDKKLEVELFTAKDESSMATSNALVTFRLPNRFRSKRVERTLIFDAGGASRPRLSSLSSIAPLEKFEKEELTILTSIVESEERKLSPDVSNTRGPTSEKAMPSSFSVPVTF